jgi:hypothetical protein
VKPLKSEGAKKCNIKKYKASELESLLGAGKVDLKKPFIVTDAIPVLDDLRRQYTSETLMANSDVELRYLSPVKAKAARSFDKQQSQVPEEEQLEYSIVSVEKYFQNCFNYKAKPDFRKTGGADTEHCEQVRAEPLRWTRIAAWTFSSCPSGLLSRRARAARRLSRRRFCRRPTPRFRPTASLDSSAGCRCWSRAGRGLWTRCLGRTPPEQGRRSLLRREVAEGSCGQGHAAPRARALSAVGGSRSPICSRSSTLKSTSRARCR